ncbi:MAG: arylamine N-acetyltransferase family protein [Nocardioidaceae bacterium]
MSNEWQVDHLDVDAYLDRIGYRAEPAATGQTLAELHRAHVTAIPFENLDLVLGRGISVDLDAVQAKLVHRGRGGYCHEHGVLFAAALTRLGYTVDRLLARIGADEDHPRPRTHMNLHVYADDGQYVADVGFGAGLLEPLPWADTRPHQQGGWTYRLAPVGDSSWRLHERIGADWSALYTFTEEPQHASDVQVANHFTATHPSSPFVGQLVVMGKDAHVRRRLVGRQFTVTWPDGTTDQQQLTDDELVTALHDQFGLPVSEEETADVLAGVPPYEHGRE